MCCAMASPLGIEQHGVSTIWVTWLEFCACRDQLEKIRKLRPEFRGSTDKNFGRISAQASWIQTVALCQHLSATTQTECQCAMNFPAECLISCKWLEKSFRDLQQCGLGPLCWSCPSFCWKPHLSHPPHGKGLALSLPSMAACVPVKRFWCKRPPFLV